MSQHKQIARAMKILRPVVASVSGRMPRGCTAVEADIILGKLAHAWTDLEAVAEIYARKEEQKP